MTTLWENTLVPVMRDIQWLQHINNGGGGLPPDVFQLLNGGAETLFGDLIFSTASLFFVFELKADQSKIRTEWKTSSGSTKHLYAYLQKLVRRIADKQDQSRKPLRVDTKILDLSLRGHHFVYPDTAPVGVSSAAIWVEPYILAAMRMVTESSFRMTALKNTYGLVPFGSGLHSPDERLPLGFAMTGDFRVARGVPTQKDRNAAEEVGPVGLSQDELDTYLEYLATAGGNDEVRTLIVDNHGHLFSVVRSVRGFGDLRQRLSEPRSFSSSSVSVAPVKISSGYFRLR